MSLGCACWQGEALLCLALETYLLYRHLQKFAGGKTSAPICVFLNVLNCLNIELYATWQVST